MLGSPRYSGSSEYFSGHPGTLLAGHDPSHGTACSATSSKGSLSDVPRGLLVLPHLNRAPKEEKMRKETLLPKPEASAMPGAPGRSCWGGRDAEPERLLLIWLLPFPAAPRARSRRGRDTATLSNLCRPSCSFLLPCPSSFLMSSSRGTLEARKRLPRAAAVYSPLNLSVQRH